jgi:hypothetical protein
MLVAARFLKASARYVLQDHVRITGPFPSLGVEAFPDAAFHLTANVSKVERQVGQVGKRVVKDAS